MNKELKTKLQELIDERSRLTKEIKKLEEEFRNDKSISFIEKLDLWYNSEDGIELNYLPFSEEYPNVRKWIDYSDHISRGVCYIKAWFEDDIVGLIEGKIEESDIKEMHFNAIKECVEKNLHSFEWDW